MSKNNKIDKLLSKFQVTSLHIENDLLTMLNYNKTYIIKSINRSKLENYNTNINYNRFEDEEIRNAVRHFVSNVLNNFNQEDLTLFYRNIPTLKIEKNNKKNSKYEVGGYNTLTNHITISNINALYHELFHVATTIFTKDSEICGFYQYNKTLDDGIGSGLNEGYTQLLTERYFIKENKKIDSYCYEIGAASALEEIIGKEKMQSYYMNANLKGIINELSNYHSTKEIFKFINRLDFICNNRYKTNLSSFRQNKIIEYIKYCDNFLLKAYITKLKAENLSQQELNQKLSNYLDLFTADIIINNKAYCIDMDNIYKQKKKSL